jgi:hypothetical protein
MLSKHSKQKFQKVGNDDLQRLFSAAFSIDPTLNPGIYTFTFTLCQCKSNQSYIAEFYNYLKESGFDEQKAILRVLDRVKQLGEYFLSASLVKSHSTNADSSEPPQSPNSLWATSASNPFVTSTNKRRRAPVENSDDDEAGKASKISCGKKPAPIFKRPAPLEESDSDPATVDDETSDDEDTHPAYRRVRDFQPARGRSKSPMPLGKNASLRTPSLTPQESSTASFATNSTSNSGQRKVANREGFDSDLPESSDIEEYEGDGSYDDDSWSDLNSELEDDIKNWSKHSLGTPPKESPKARSSPSRGGNLNDLVLKHQNNTKATAWCHYLAKPFYPKNLDLVEEPTHNANPHGEYDLKALPKYLDKVRKAVWNHETRNITFPLPSNWHDEKTGKSFYPSMRIDGVDFYPGDCVMVRCE